MPKDFTIIHSEIYPFDILVSVHDSYEKLSRELKRRLPDDCFEAIKRFESIGTNGNRGKTVMFDTGSVCIWIKGTPTENTIAHEAFHAIDFILDKVGMTFSSDSDEAYAYFLGFVVQKIHDFIKAQPQP
jgi:hypothetical protein